MKFQHPLSVRYADTDAQGHVFFANYFTFFDEAMTGYLHAVGLSPTALADLGVDFVYVDAQCQYKGSTYFEDALRIGCRFADFGRTSVTARFEIFSGQTAAPVAMGRLVFVCVSREGRGKVAVPQGLIDAVAGYEG